MISLIAAVAKNGVIGNKNQLPWNIPEDLKNFKKITSGNTIVMGFRTFESIGKPLLNRKNIILTKETEREIDFKLKNTKDLFFVNSISEVFEISNPLKEEIFIIGGSQIYKLFIEQNLIQKVYLTLINEDFEGDTFLSLDFLENFKKVEDVECFTSNIGYNFQIFEKLD